MASVFTSASGARGGGPSGGGDDEDRQGEEGSEDEEEDVRGCDAGGVLGNPWGTGSAPLLFPQLLDMNMLLLSPPKAARESPTPLRAPLLTHVICLVVVSYSVFNRNALACQNGVTATAAAAF
eukprot:524992-Pyramimonas_sp.AAC.1